MHETPYRTAYNYVRMPQAEWDVFILHKEKLLKDAEERVKAEGGEVKPAEEPEAIEEPKAEELAAIEVPKAEKSMAEEIKAGEIKAKLEEIEARLMPRKIEPEEPKAEPIKEQLKPWKTKLSEEPEPEAFRAESAVIRPEAIEPVLVKDFGVCEKCGAEILRENAKFCWNCGHDIRPKRLKCADKLRSVLDKTSLESERHALEYAIDVLEAGRW